MKFSNSGCVQTGHWCIWTSWTESLVLDVCPGGSDSKFLVPFMFGRDTSKRIVWTFHVKGVWTAH